MDKLKNILKKKIPAQIGVAAILASGLVLGGLATQAPVIADFDLAGLNQQVQNHEERLDNHEARIGNTEKDVEEVQKNTNTAPSSQKTTVPGVSTPPATQTQSGGTIESEPTPAPAPPPITLTQIYMEVSNCPNAVYSYRHFYSDGSQVVKNTPDDSKKITQAGACN